MMALVAAGEHCAEFYLHKHSSGIQAEIGCSVWWYSRRRMKTAGAATLARASAMSMS